MAQTLEHNKEVTTVVPVTIPAFDDDLNIIQKLDDEPNDVGGLTAAELKAKFDEGNLSAQQYINNVLIPTVIADDLSEQARQAAEAERVANEIDRATNEQAREKAEKERVNETSGVVALATAQAEAAAESARKATQAALGQIVDGSLEPAKFSGESRSMMVRENLLDNWYFGNPVNQRGQTEYTGAVYGIDRWRGSSDEIEVELRDTDIKVNASAAWTDLFQIVENPSLYAGKKVTVSVLVTEVENANGWQIVVRNVEVYAYTTITAPGLYSATWTIPEDAESTMQVIIQAVNATPGYIGVLAAKLELGSQQTLAHQDENGKWVLNEIPNYGDQLRKCQRYYQKISSLSTAIQCWSNTNSSASISVPLCVPMRVQPAVTLTPTVVMDAANAIKTINNYYVAEYQAETSSVRIRLETDTWTMGTGLFIGNVVLDANL